MIPSPSFKTILISSIFLRIALILYSEWHDARSLIKYTDVDYRVFTDAARFILQPTENNHAQGPLSQYLGYELPIGDPYTRDTYRYTPILALLLTPNIFLHPSFGKYIFALCDIINGLIIYKLLIHHILPSKSNSKPSKGNEQTTTTTTIAQKATLYTAVHLLNPMVFSISTRGSSESIQSLFILLTLYALFTHHFTTSAILLGISTHWKLYPIIYGVSCLAVIGKLKGYGWGRGEKGLKGWLKTVINKSTIKFGFISAGTFVLLGLGCYLIWGYPFLYESYLYHLNRLDHRHNFSPYFYSTYLTYPTLINNLSSYTIIPSPTSSTSSLIQKLLTSPLTSFLPQMILSLGTGLLFGHKLNSLPFTWFIQTVTFVIFNKVCTSQYFLWYLLLLPLILPSLNTLTLRQSILCFLIWTGTQALWLSEAYKLEFLGKDVFFGLWIRGLIYVIGNCWVLSTFMNAYTP